MKRGILVLMNLLHPGLVPHHFSIIIDVLRTKPSGILQNDGLSRDWQTQSFSISTEKTFENRVIIDGGQVMPTHWTEASLVDDIRFA